MRPPDWEFRLVEYAQAQLGRPFLWGETDCFSLARGALDVILGADPLADVPAYATARGAHTVARARPDIGAELERRGGVRVPIGFAQQGDVLTLPGDDGTGLPVFGFVVDGRGRFATSSQARGVEILPIPAFGTAWRF